MTAKELKASILDLAIRGKLVPQDPNDEPAEKLLARIAAGKAKLVKSGKLKKEKPLPPITDDDKPFGLPRGWAWCRLGDVCSKVGAGATPLGGRSVYVHENEGVKFIREQNVQDSGLSLEDVAYISESAHLAKIGSEVHACDLLVNITGASIGRNSLVPDDFDRANVNQHVLIVRLLDVGIRHYLHWFLISSFAFGQMLDQQKGDKPGLSAERVKKFFIPIPPLAEQKRIVEKIEQLMPLVERYGQAEEKRRQLITALPEALKKSILKSAVEGKLVPQDPNDEPAARKSAIEKIPYSLPSNWVWKRISEVTEFQEGPGIGKDDFRPKGIPLIRISGMQESVVHLLGCNYLDPEMVREKWDHFRLDRGDVVISTSASLDKVAVVDDECVGAIPYTGLIRFKMTSSIDREYFRLYIQSPEYARQIDEQKKGGSIKHYGPTHLRKMTIPIPPLAEQKRIVAKTAILFAITGGLGGGMNVRR